eukprot:CAMPEP_0177772590 /NCGR_PEP_ID=MMETSP0491_2-20121128/12328_1 /TAXON_ID=63592 /ORGANISM="Tetraselmis chuii, Strain PLY429" /LENGTH=619 /DNA_ID=CAMNT_0019290459 /DNA_START=629 /DNA_END=2488 /DNA_ORIENTATION=+
MERATYTEPVQVREYIQKYQASLGNSLNGDIYFNITCHSPDYKYPLTLVDLPGLPDDSSNQNYKVARDMAKAHIQKLDGCVVMNVSKAETDYDIDGNDFVKGFLKTEVGWTTDKKIEDSTVRVLTMIDKYEGKSLESILQHMNSEGARTKYPHGTFFIANVDEAESMVFNQSVYEPHQAQCGHEQLAKAISELQLNAVKSSIPDMEEVINRELSAYKAEMQQYRNSVPEGEHGRSMYFSMLVNDLVRELSKSSGWKPCEKEVHGKQRVVVELHKWLAKELNPETSSIDQKFIELWKCERWRERTMDYINGMGSHNPDPSKNRNMSLKNRIQKEDVLPTFERSCLTALDHCFNIWYAYSVGHLDNELENGSNKVLWQRMPRLTDFVKQSVIKTLKAARDNAEQHLRRTLEMFDYIWEFQTTVQEGDIKRLGEMKWGAWESALRITEDVFRADLTSELVTAVTAAVVTGATGATLDSKVVVERAVKGVLEGVCTSMSSVSKNAALHAEPGSGGSRSEWLTFYKDELKYVCNYNKRLVQEPVLNATVRAVDTFLLREYASNLSSMASEELHKKMDAETLKALMEEDGDMAAKMELLRSKVEELEECNEALQRYKASTRSRAP